MRTSGIGIVLKWLVALLFLAMPGLADNLSYAALRGDIDAARQFLEDGADPDAPYKYGFTALHEASKTGQAETVALLPTHGATAGDLRAVSRRSPPYAADDHLTNSADC